MIYIARMVEAVYVLHAFQKKTQQTSQRDVDLARARLKELMREQV
ncbi:MAG TPA: type II toxin-antitoxin system RelE/ParE family toxin [Granulicella sp.]